MKDHSMKTGTQPSENSGLHKTDVPSRIAYLDNLRTHLVSLVVLHHVAIGYGGAGGWLVTEAPTDTVSPILFLVFNAVNQSYFMSCLYLLAGYFLAGAYDRKGARRCLRDRLKRLGLPLLVYVLLLSPFIRWGVINFARGKAVSFWSIVSDVLTFRNVGVGPLWFVELLLIFSIFYIVLRGFVRGGADTPFGLWPNRFPKRQAIGICIVLLTLGTFCVRIFFRWESGSSIVNPRIAFIMCSVSGWELSPLGTDGRNI